MKITDKKIAIILYNYPLGVSTMLINVIEMFKEDGNKIYIISNNDQTRDLPCEPWLNDLFVPVSLKKRCFDRVIKIVRNRKLLYLIARNIWRILPKKKSNGNLTWEQKNCDIFKFSKDLKLFLNNNRIDIIVSVECFSLIAVDEALKEMEHKPDIIYFDMELLDWSPENPLYSDKLELKQRQFNALKKVKHVAITSFKRARIFAKINQFSEEYISVLPVVPRARKITNRSNYFRNKFNISENKKIVLYSGNFMPWAQCLEIIESVKNWPQNAELVMHTWNKDALDTDYFKKMKQSADGLPVHFSSEYLVYEELCSALSSADIGLLYYAEIDDNFTEICFSSNKMGEYLASGLPIICSPFQSLKEFVNEHEVGFSVPIKETGNAVGEILKDLEFYRKKVKKCCDEYFVFDRYYENAFQNIRKTPNIIK